ncbi:cytochrome P450 [Lentinula aff. lateritia]|uniref:Cytochrome P450 n=1 Tax=Lentinula aff. lateritia TaxID=2804960 RepID=A0ACC1U5E1_9AGAR|nr:cytochrome P450 [Lentinula aff. lateritia]
MPSSTTWFIFGITLIFLTVTRCIADSKLRKSKYKNVIFVGPTGIGTVIGFFQLLLGIRDFIQEGYDQHYGKLFAIPTLFQMTIVVSGHDLIEDIRKASDDQLSLYGSIKEGMQTDYTMEPHILENPYHFRFIHLSLTRDLGGRFPELKEEVIAAFSELVPPTDSEEFILILRDFHLTSQETGPPFRLGLLENLWSSESSTDYLLVLHFVCPSPYAHCARGLPYMRQGNNSDYNEINDAYSDALVKTALIIGFTPGFLKPIVSRLLDVYIPKTLRRAMKHVSPLVEERLEKEKLFGADWAGKSNDLLTWLIEKTPERDKLSVTTIKAITIRLLATMFAAYRPASMALTQALFDLATFPAYIPELRAEVESIVKEEGISKDSIGKMYKLDSFVKESLRLRAGGKASMPRKVLKDFTFSNGTTVFAGSTIIAPGYAIHHDARHYSNPADFDGFRFARLREEQDDPVRYQMVSVNPTFMMFGNGRHACPGRFLVSALLKTMLAHVLITYDIKLEHNGRRPTDKWYTFSPAPNQTAGLLFRRRRSAPSC